MMINDKLESIHKAMNESCPAGNHDEPTPIEPDFIPIPDEPTPVVIIPDEIITIAEGLDIKIPDTIPDTI